MRNAEKGRGVNRDASWDDMESGSERRHRTEKLGKVARTARQTGEEFHDDYKRAERLMKRAGEGAQETLERDDSNGVWKKIVKKIGEPKTVGFLGAIGFGALIMADVVLNGPSNFVVDSPAAATTALVAGSAIAGYLTSWLARRTEASAKRPSGRERTKFLE